MEMDEFFISALARAGTCKKHLETSGLRLPQLAWPSPMSKLCSSFLVPSKAQSRQFTGNARRRGAAQSATVEITQDELAGLVDFYEPLPAPSEQAEKPPAQGNPLEEQLVQDRGSPHKPWPVEGKEGQAAIDYLTELLAREDASHECIFEAYKALPQPGVLYLPIHTIRGLFRRLAVVEHKTQSSMLRYLSVADDMKYAGIPMTSGEWSSAIAFVGRCFRKVSSDHVRDALHKWTEMEQEAGVRGTHVTFNILFDIATKAGKYVLADMIMKEMRARGLECNRFFRVGLIYYYGLKADGNGVRKAYKDLVEAGEAVDTTVMNCVIASLVRAGEVTAAEQVYERMKMMHLTKTGSKLPPRHWREVRELGRLLDRKAHLARGDPDLIQKLQVESPVAPDLRTYKILIRHHSIEMGNIDRVTELLDEMQTMEVPMHGSIFLYLFVGFSQYGGVRYTSWTKSRLEQVWKAFITALESNGGEVYWSRTIAETSLQAFAKCAGLERTMEIWEEIQTRWKPEHEEKEGISRMLRKNVQSSL